MSDPMGKNVILTHMLPATENSCYSSERHASTTVLMNKLSPYRSLWKGAVYKCSVYGIQPRWPLGDQISRNLFFIYFLFSEVFTFSGFWKQVPSWAWAVSLFSACKGLAQIPENLRKKMTQLDSVRLGSFLHGYFSLKFQGW